MAFRKLFFVAILACALPGYGQTVVAKANVFLNSLTPELRKRTVFDIADGERFNWHFVPVARKGTSLNDFNTEQRTAALDFLKASVSHQGYEKASAIMELERVLMVIEKQAAESHYRDPLNYHFFIFGTPSDDKPWGWRFEGHHCSISLMLDKGKIVSSTPSFFGTNPGVVRIDLQRGKEVLRKETALGFELIGLLSEEQRSKAVFAEKAPPEIITLDHPKADVPEQKGISYVDLNPAQRAILMQLLDCYILNYETGFASALSAKIRKAGLDNLTFAWAGSLVPGVPNYYRIQGPGLLIEYDNTQNDANHVHTSVRDLTNDFAEDVLREHYRTEHR